MWEKQRTMKMIEFHTNYDNRPVTVELHEILLPGKYKRHLKKNINFKPTKGQVFSVASGKSAK